MQDYNKMNLYFLLCCFAILAIVFATVVMLTYVGKAGLWSTPIPVAAEGYCIYHLVKLAIKYKKASEIQKEDKK